MLCWSQWWQGTNSSETHYTHHFCLQHLTLTITAVLWIIWIFSVLKTHVPGWRKNLQGGFTLFYLGGFIHHLICMRFSSSGIMPLCWSRSVWFPVVLGAALVVLTACNAGPNQGRRQTGSSSCFGGFDLYFVLDKWVTWHTDTVREDRWTR